MKPIGPTTGHRCPSYLQGTSEKNTIYLHPADWYAEHHFDLRLLTRVTAIDRAAHSMRTDDGQHLGYAEPHSHRGARRPNRAVDQCHWTLRTVLER